MKDRFKKLNEQYLHARVIEITDTSAIFSVMKDCYELSGKYIAQFAEAYDVNCRIDTQAFPDRDIFYLNTIKHVH